MWRCGLCVFVCVYVYVFCCMTWVCVCEKLWKLCNKVINRIHYSCLRHSKPQLAKIFVNTAGRLLILRFEICQKLSISQLLAPLEGIKKFLGYTNYCESVRNILKRIGNESEENPLGCLNHAQRCPKSPH